MALNEARVILKLRDDELEDLIKKWIANEKSNYVDFDRNSGAGDRGLDAVGFLTRNRYEGAWHNYQCKQLSIPLGETAFFSEIGKVLFYAAEGEFTLPERYIFVAPMSIVGSVRRLLGMPSKLKSEIKSNWSNRCGKRIIANVDIPMTAKISACIEAFDFSKIEAWNAHKLVEQPNLRKVLHEHVDIDPGVAPAGTVHVVAFPPQTKTAGSVDPAIQNSKTQSRSFESRPLSSPSLPAQPSWSSSRSPLQLQRLRRQLGGLSV